MKRFYFILYFLLMSPCIYAQYSNEYANACDSTSKFLVVPIMPEFEGGTARLIEILNANLNIDKKVKATIHLRSEPIVRERRLDFQCMTGSMKH